jgi:hypothetical protein
MNRSSCCLVRVLLALALVPFSPLASAQDKSVRPGINKPFENPDVKDFIISLANWLPPALVGTTFTLLGSLKLYGLWKGVVGGGDKPFITRLCGT